MIMGCGTNCKEDCEIKIPRPAGTPGPQGDQGPQGDPGVPGSDGFEGGTGTKGSQGPQGDRGDKGDRGAKGDTGAKGIQGPAGVGVTSTVKIEKYGSKVTVEGGRLRMDNVNGDEIDYFNTPLCPPPGDTPY